jgi:succinate dehydrogenase / fumarate reductase, cytochrome b subunit
VGYSKGKSIDNPGTKMTPEPSMQRGWLCSTIGRKQVIGVTGLGLSLFVLAHMAGNMLMFVSPQAYNEYGHALVSNPLIYVAEAGLIAFFAGHLLLALKLAWENAVARPQRYAVAASGDKATSLVQKTLWAQGLLILVFVILHLITFKFGTVYMVDYGAGPIRDLHRLMVEVFSIPMYVVWYVVALVVLGLHLSHGLGSTFQTLGLHHPKYQGLIKCLSRGYALIVAGGFLAQPIYIFFFHQG